MAFMICLVAQQTTRWMSGDKTKFTLINILVPSPTVSARVVESTVFANLNVQCDQPLTAGDYTVRPA